jgi:hypothetical protein
MKINQPVSFKIKIFMLVALLGMYIKFANASDLTHQWKSPSFSGQGYSSHVLTIENQEHTRVMTIKEEVQALVDEIARDKDNTTLARFVRNLESRVYAQLSRQMVDNLFGESPSTSGTIELEGNTISYNSDGEFITLTVVDSDGTTTDISLPIGSFTF